MKTIFFILITLIMFPICAGCTTPITGKIVDAETGQPIEGAILLVEWTKVHGFGNTYTSSEKAVEIFSDKDGLVHIPGYNDVFAEKPNITIYKPGYVAWNNRWIFPDSRNRTDFEWKEGYVFRLNRFKPGYTYNEHVRFIDLCIGTGLYEQKSHIKQAIRFEEKEASKEVDEKIKEWKDKKHN
jgi:hypothetical protein